MARQRRWSDDMLRAAVATARSFRDVMRTLGLDPRGSVHWDIRARVAALGISTGHFDVTSRAWSDAELCAAVAASRSYVEVVDALGLDLSAALHERVRRRIALLGLDTSHFTRTRKRVEQARSWSDAQLAATVASASSLADVLRALGLVPAGGNYATMRAHVARLRLDTSHFTTHGWRKMAAPRSALAEILVEGSHVATHALKLRLFAEGLKAPRCELCGWCVRSPDGRVPVELDHINGVRTDNRIENLRILCPNCHSLQSTHRGRNKRTARSRARTSA